QEQESCAVGDLGWTEFHEEEHWFGATQLAHWRRAHRLHWPRRLRQVRTGTTSALSAVFRRPGLIRFHSSATAGRDFTDGGEHGNRIPGLNQSQDTISLRKSNAMRREVNALAPSKPSKYPAAGSASSTDIAVPRERQLPIRTSASAACTAEVSETPIRCAPASPRSLNASRLV